MSSGLPSVETENILHNEKCSNLGSQLIFFLLQDVILVAQLLSEKCVLLPMDILGFVWREQKQPKRAGTNRVGFSPNFMSMGIVCNGQYLQLIN